MENSSTMKDVEDETEMALTDAEDCGAATDYGSLDRDIQAQRVVALEERRLDAAIEELLKLENQMRCAADVSRTRRIVVAIIQLCYEARAWKTLNDQIHLLSQRQQQLQQAVKAMIQQAAKYVDDTPDMDTRNKLIETLNNVSSAKGLRKIFWYVVLAPHDNLQSDATKNTVEILKQSDLPRACESSPETVQEQLQECQAQLQEQSPKRKYEKCIQHFQDQSLEELYTPSCESRPSTPPPQQETKAKEIPKFLFKKVATSQRPVRRRLLDSPSPAELEDFFSDFEERERKRFTDRYNFDPLMDAPLPGRFEWVNLQPKATAATYHRSRTTIRRSSTV
ncbi:unnamed protein product [Sphagnum jensenii]|uniref:Cyclin-dependent kinase inhibitor n=1 Tax=Sphagnum jensenii TaxID=128206 RepID=A0ABP0VP49_9BRYO